MFITFSGIENARDLGGLAMADGRRVRPGLLLRSGNLSRATDEDVVLLRDHYHLSDVFDFRFGAEAGADPDRVIEGVSYHSLPTLPQVMIDGFASGRAESEQLDSKDFVAALADYAFQPQAQELSRMLYPAIVNNPLSQERYGEFLRGVLNAEGASLWHCSQGKDRAGLAAAFVLAALGADRKTIIADFDRSNEYFAPFVAAFSEKVKAKGGGEAELAFVQAMVGVSVPNFLRALGMIEAQWGSLAGYVENVLGFAVAEQYSLREKYLQ